MSRQRAALIGALAVPFYVLPVFLTIMAWDLYGGFAVHGWIALGLAALGAIGGALSAPWLTRDAPEPAEAQPTSPRRLVVTIQVVLLFVVAVVLWWVQALVTAPIATALQLTRPADLLPVINQPPPPPLVLPLYAALLGSLVFRKEGRDVGTRIGLSAAAWCVLVAMTVGRSAGGDAAGAATLAGGLALLGAAMLAWTASPARARTLGVAGRIGVGAALGPIVIANLSAALPHTISLVTAGRIGLGLGALAGLASLRWAGTTRLRRPGPLDVARVLLLPSLVMYIGFAVAIAPSRMLPVAALFGLVTLGSRWTPRRVPLFPALWLFFYVCFGQVVLFKEGSAEPACRALAATTEARPILLRHDGDAELRSAHPYDLELDQTGRWLVVTFKRYDERGGFIEVVGVDDPSRTTRRVTRREGSELPLWPERFVMDPKTGWFYLGLLGVDLYVLEEVELQDTGAAAPTPVARTTVRLLREPSYPALDASNRRLIQPNLGEEKTDADPDLPLVDSFTVPGLQHLGKYSPGILVNGMAEYVAVDETTGRYYLPLFYNVMRFALVEIDGATHTPTRAVETFHPTIGLAVDAPAARIYATNVLAGTLDTYDLVTLERIHSVRTGDFPRDVAFDAARGLLHVGAYGDGRVSSYAVRQRGRPVLPVHLQDVQVGTVLRGITAHAESGRIFAASPCGVFEVPAPQL